MNLTLQNPSYSNEGFVLDFPEVIEEYLYQDSYYTQCIAFNRRGTLLAAGCNNGAILIWDFDTRGVAKELKAEGEHSLVSSLAWSKDGRRLVSAALDKKISFWDVASGQRLAVHVSEHIILRVALHPKASSTCLACPQQGAPMLLEGFGVLGEQPQCHLLPNQDESAPVQVQGGPGKGKGGEGPGILFGAAAFNKRGDLVFVGTTRGDILVVETATRIFFGKMHVQGGSPIRQIVVSRNGQYLLTNSNDRTLRIFKIEIPVENAAQAASQLGAAQQAEAAQGVAPLKKKLTSPFFTYVIDHKDPINMTHWQTACFSGDNEYVMGAAAQAGEHRLILWGTTYPQIMRTLEGPKESVRDMAWHPTRPIVASVANNGIIYLWAKEYQENWSAFAPDFKELQENDEYDEREDEFDSNPRDDELPKGQQEVESDADIDIETVDKVGAYSDSDEDGLYFLPVEPEPDPPEVEVPAVTDELTRAAARLLEVPGPSSRQDDAIGDVDGLGGKRRRKPRVSFDDAAFRGPAKSKKVIGKGDPTAKGGMANGKKTGKMKGKKKGGAGLKDRGQGAGGNELDAQGGSSGQAEQLIEMQ